MSELGPLAPLEGDWEGNVGLDVSFSYDHEKIGETTYFEKASFVATGIQTNGSQDLYDLKYEMTAWRHGEEDQAPFHNEVGYMIWDAGNGQVIRCFAVPRGIAVLAGGDATEDSKSMTFTATPDEDYGFLQNKYLLDRARTTAFTSTFTINDDDSFTYTSDLLMTLAALGEPMHHTDTNTLHRV